MRRADRAGFDKTAKMEGNVVKQGVSWESHCGLMSGTQCVLKAPIDPC